MHISVPLSLEHTGAYQRWPRGCRAMARPRGFKQRWIQSQQLCSQTFTFLEHSVTGHRWMLWERTSRFLRSAVTHLKSAHFKVFVNGKYFNRSSTADVHHISWKETLNRFISSQCSCVPVENSYKTPGLSPLIQTYSLENSRQACGETRQTPHRKTQSQEIVAASSLYHFRTS